jgi:hypothetical protein
VGDEIPGDVGFRVGFAARDGLGLPGSHGCGAKGIQATQSYPG